ncbi:Vacuolar protein sorting-associated protein 8 [Friedmanniomyces endolithicus]|uniref:Vacuolar protein sorting-associated protein 8 n=2 Tax=Dothideomycetidae TaxID=451867 RepID=A0AAN6JWH5_9PEZI|nr:Vacuolar protein sorting-associated protein 8 [Friedmanniomyces endolithicus]KAK0951607.1 Vacuolar protein sorting-associated protein 8 [Friedmanniomyces endolithicus]KAK0973171.1 Vacuolar protein sorting-associated protein 8 [Friedmanniomyces endolithicus]KAK1034563.1 Vacuolar protein sorting-associated protein 8 [Friedmanniomyces endolithicus]
MSSLVGGLEEGGTNEDVEADESSRTGDQREIVGDEPLEEHVGKRGQWDIGEMQDSADLDEAGERLDEQELLDQDVPQLRLQEDEDERPDEQELLEEDVPRLRIEEGEEGLDTFPSDARPDGDPATPPGMSPLASPADSGSIPDDTPSLQGSLLSSPGRLASSSPSKPAGPRRTISRTASGALKPFERRFETRLSASPSGPLRPASPGFLSPHSRQISLSSQFSQVSSQGDATSDDETLQAPWEVVRWTKLRKITGQALSEVGKRNFGRPTCLAVSALIAIGTSKGLVLGFDYHQTLKIIIGQGTKATECGSVTALSIAADYSTVVAGHANGHIFTWEVSKPARPFLQIPPLDRGIVQQQQHPDGHVVDCAILHVGFLGTRHTALVSADAAGMAFSHVATRGLGPVVRVVKTTRLLGRYSTIEPKSERSQKPSSVLAFSPLPLGNVEQATDGMGITALLTPYLLVIVSTTPIAQTQHKSPRPREIKLHSTLSGCLAWFPAVKLKASNAEKDRENSDTKLVYCWSNVLTVMDLTVTENEDPAKPASLAFRARSRWRAEEAIVAVQWLGRSVLGIMTVSQRLLIVEDGSLQVTDSIDLLHRHIYHQDLFSQQLRSVVENLDSDDPSLHGVVADAFYMSFRAYKGRMFLLGFNDLTVGTLSNWADRLMALMEAGDHIAAIRLATDYYVGSSNNVSVGLPENDESRHEVVKERLLAMISASLKYSFSQYDEERPIRLRKLAEASFEACSSMGETDYLFSDVFDAFEDAEEPSIYIGTLEPYILDGEIKVLPTEVVQSMVSHFISENQAARLEELLCRLDPSSFDFDQITTLCRQHGLYDALVYVWTQGIGDFVTPLVELLTLVKMLQDGGEDDRFTGNPFYDSAMKVFPYLAYSLTGRRYPNGELMGDREATMIKADLYEYVFAGTPIAWPLGSNRVFRTTKDAQNEPAFPYLVLLLEFDAANFMSMLNEAFEDSFLNEAEEDSGANDTLANGTIIRPGYKMTRQHIISIMLDVMRQHDFGRGEVIYLDMFIARSLPKYPGQLVLSGSLLTQVLQRLCQPPSDDLQDDCQLSIEYLLSAYRPPNVSTLVQALREAHFFRVLKSVYRGERLFTELLEVYFEDPQDRVGVFDCIGYCLRSSTAASEKQVQAVKRTIMQHLGDLANVDVTRTARTLAMHAKDLLQPAFAALTDTYQQFVFLRTLLEPGLLQGARDTRAGTILPPSEAATFVEQYVRLMCVHDPGHVADYVNILPTSDLRLDSVLPAMEAAGVIDAAVIVLSNDGRIRDAMDRLVAHLRSLEQALTSLIYAAGESPDAASTQEAANDLVEAVEKYTKVGIWLCQGQSANAERRPRPRTNFAWDVPEDDLDLDEYLRLKLVDAVVQLANNTSRAVRHSDEQPTSAGSAVLDLSRITASLRTNVQQAFTALLTATATPSVHRRLQTTGPPNSTQDNLSFLRVLRAFLARAAVTAPSLSDLRAVLSDIFAAYAYEQGILSVANELIGSDVFQDISDVHDMRQRGWRPRAQVCEHCKRRAWSQGIGEIVWDAWVLRERRREADKARKRVERGGGEEARKLERGKAKADATVAVDQDDTQGEDSRRLTLVVFACRHVFHRVPPPFDTNHAMTTIAVFLSAKATHHPHHHCPPFEGDFNVTATDLYPESADWDPVHCRLYVGAAYNASFIIYDPYSTSYETVEIPGISHNPDYEVSGVDYDARTGAMYICVTFSKAFSSTITGNASLANFTGPNAIVKYDTNHGVIDYITSFVGIQSQIEASTGKLVNGFQDMAEDTKGNSYAIATFGNTLVKLNPTGEASLWYESPNITDVLGFEGLFSIGDKLVVSNRLVSGFSTFDTTKPAVSVTVQPTNLPTNESVGWDGLLAPTKYGGRIALSSDDAYGTRVFASNDDWDTAKYIGGVPRPADITADSNVFVISTDSYEINDRLYSLTAFFQLPHAKDPATPIETRNNFTQIDITDGVAELVKAWWADEGW